MNIFFENSGRYYVATVVKRNTDTTWIESIAECSLKRVKNTKIFFTFETPLSQFWEKAQQCVQEYNCEQVWYKTQGQLFNSIAFLESYLNTHPDAHQLAGFILFLSQHPLHFYRKGQGQFQAATRDILAKSLQTQQKKQQQQERIMAWKNSLLNGIVPSEIRADIRYILFSHIKNLDTYKAYQLAASELNLSFQELSIQLKIYESSLDYLLHQFFYQNDFIDFKTSQAMPLLLDELPLEKNEQVQAFSIDSSDTTEIDDAISLSGLGDETLLLGVHIALPSYTVHSNQILEKKLMHNVSSVYLPHTKLTLLPDNWIQAFSLSEGCDKPVISAYFEINNVTQEVIAKYSKVEKIQVKKNLSLETLDQLLSHETCKENIDLFDSELKGKLNWLYTWTKNHRQKRMTEEMVARDNFFIQVKDEQIHIDKRHRNSPVNLVVEELMILANSFWATELKNNQITAIYRAHKQSSGSVYFCSTPSPHSLMNLDCYAWFSSPLRRVVDYVNQIQLLSLLLPEYATQLAFSKDEIKKLIPLLQSKYIHIQKFQKQVEYYWCLKFIEKQQIQYLEVSIHKNGVLKALHYPLKFKNINVPEELICRDMIQLEIKKLNLDNLQMDVILRE